MNLVGIIGAMASKIWWCMCMFHAFL